MPKRLTASTFLTLSAVAAAFVGVLVFFGVRKIDVALIAAGVTFIVSLVGIATLALMVPEQNNDPDKPVLR
jgi:uncharacterized membrane protein YkgB